MAAVSRIEQRDQRAGIGQDHRPCFSLIPATTPATAITVGVTWRDFSAGLCEIGRRWDIAGIAWAVTGAIAASMLAPYLAAVTTGEVYVDKATVAGIESVAAQAGLRVAPWPRVYADLRAVGVRGEEAVEHLREIVRGQ